MAQANYPTFVRITFLVTCISWLEVQQRIEEPQEWGENQNQVLDDIREIYVAYGIAAENILKRKVRQDVRPNVAEALPCGLFCIGPSPFLSW
jgi:hypothetical protein